MLFKVIGRKGGPIIIRDFDNEIDHENGGEKDVIYRVA